MNNLVINWREEGFDKFTFRASSFGHAMTNPKSLSNRQKYNNLQEKIKVLRSKRDLTPEKSQGTKTYEKIIKDIATYASICEKLKQNLDAVHLSDTCKTYLADIYTSAIYNRHEDVQSKYLKKGLAVEEDVITLYSLHTGNNHKKNAERKRNEFFEGELDFSDTYDRGIDAKANWSIFQFMRTKNAKIKSLYEYQGRIYMNLWGFSKFRIVNGLVNTPEHLIAQEEKSLLYSFVGTEDEYKEACLEIRRNHIYDDIPLSERLRFFDIERDEEIEFKMKERAIECRRYLNDLLNNKVAPTDEEGEEEEGDE